MDLIEYYQLTNYLETLQLPENLLAKEQKKLKNKAVHYLIQNKALFRRNQKDLDAPLKVIRPMEVEEILVNEHSIPTTGHFGIEATYNRISQSYYWPKMHLDIENYIKACDVCQ